MNTSPVVAVRVVARGRVQGVGFRAWTMREAARLSLSGWIRNRLDGTVEALIVGSADTVSAMVDAMRRGPPGARVGDLDTVPVDAGDPIPTAGFEIR